MTEPPQHHSLKAGESQNGSTERTAISTIIQWLTVVGAAIVAGVFVIGTAMTMLYDPRLYNLALEHVPATAGLPLAALASLAIVICLRTTNGPIEFEGVGFKFRGASGPIVMWVVCFLAITVAIKLLWIEQ